MKTTIRIVFSFLFLLLGQNLSASSLQIAEGKVEFIALASPGALKISGRQNESQALKGNISVDKDQITGVVFLKLDSLTTGISLRDRHMKENYLEVPKFPECQFTYTKLSLPSDFKGGQIPFEGKLKLHGIERPVSGLVSVEKKESRLSLVHEFKIKTGDFGISTPKYMSVTMGEEVVVKVSLEGNML